MKRLILIFAALTAAASAQVIVSTPQISYNASTLPSTCTQWSTALNTSAPSGQKFYVCETPNNWVQQGGSGSGLTSITIQQGGSNAGTATTINCTGTLNCSTNNGVATFNGTSSGNGGGNANVPTLSVSGTTLNFFSGCATIPCSVSRGGGQVDNFTAPNSITSVPSGLGSVWVWWTKSGCQVGSTSGGLAIGGSGPCTGTSVTASGFPQKPTAIISVVTYGAGSWGVPVNYQPTASNPQDYQAGTGLSQDSSAGTTTFSVDPAAVPVFGTGGRLPLTYQHLTVYGPCNSSTVGVAAVDDLQSVTWGATAAGGGGSKGLVFCDSINWTVLGL